MLAHLDQRLAHTEKGTSHLPTSLNGKMLGTITFREKWSWEFCFYLAVKIISGAPRRVKGAVSGNEPRELSERLFVQNSIVELVQHLECIWGKEVRGSSFWVICKDKCVGFNLPLWLHAELWKDTMLQHHASVTMRGRIVEGALTRCNTGRSNSKTRRSVSLSSSQQFSTRYGLITASLNTQAMGWCALR